MTAAARRPRRLGPPGGAVPRPGARGFLDLERADLVWLLILVLGALVVRVASPVFPDLLSGGGGVSASGLGYPYNGGQCTDAPVDSGGHILPATTQTQQAGRPATVKPPDQRRCGMVFDEVYFPVDAAKDARQPPDDYFDPEPPLTKLLMAPGERLLGFGTWSWRITQAITGSLFVGLVYLIAWRLRRERFFAVVAATVVALDGLAIAESRTGVIDMPAVFIASLAFYVFLLHWGARTRGQWLATLYAFAAAVGLAFGAKLTAVAPVVAAAAMVLARLLEPALLRRRRRRRGWRADDGGAAQMWRDAAGGWRSLRHYVLAAGLALLVFTACYARYLTVDHTLANFSGCVTPGGPTLDTSKPTNGSPYPGYTLYTAPSLSHGGNPLSKAVYFAGDTYRDVRAQVQASLTYHSVECRGHDYSSRWYTWPVVAHPVLFYVGTGDGGAPGVQNVAYITDMGNPAAWWLAIPALLFCVYAMTRGPVGLRLLPLALLSVALALMIGSYRAAEHPGVAAVHPGALFLVGAGLMAVFGLVTMACAALLRRFTPAVIVLGYLAAWLMWVFGNEKRVLFYYHMLGALPFMALGLAYALSALRGAAIPLTAGAGAAPGRRLALRPLAWAGVGLIVAGFVFFYPVWTGLPQSDADHNARMWFTSWFFGWPT